MKSTQAIVISALIILSLVGCDRAYRWEKFPWEAGNCSILMPVTPQPRDASVKTPLNGEVKIKSYMAKIDEQNAYLIGYIDYPDGVDLKNPKQIFETMINNFELKGYKVNSQTENNFNGYPEVAAEVAKGNHRVAMRMYLVDRRLYQLNSAFMADDPHPKEIEKYFNSFSLQKN